MTTTDLINLFDITIFEGGFTVRRETLAPVTSGFAVSTTDTQWVVPADIPFRHFMIAVEQLHRFFPDADAIGAWINGDRLYFDPVEIHTDREIAEKAGRARGEIAIFDLSTGTEITL
jgi:hypothetical protein